MSGMSGPKGIIPLFRFYLPLIHRSCSRGMKIRENKKEESDTWAGLSRSFSSCSLSEGIRDLDSRAQVLLLYYIFSTFLRLDG